MKCQVDEMTRWQVAMKVQLDKTLFGQKGHVTKQLVGEMALWTISKLVKCHGTTFPAVDISFSFLFFHKSGIASKTS